MSSEYKGPTIIETPLEETPSPIGLSCCPVTLNPLVPENTMKATGFDAVTGDIISILTSRTFGPILFDDHEIVEAHRSLTNQGQAVRKEVHLIGVIDGSIQCRLREIRPLSQDILKEDAIETMISVFPMDLSPDYSASRTVQYMQGDYVAEETFQDTVTGLFDLTIDDDDTCRCICFETRREGTEDRVVRTFVSCDTGRVVLVRLSDPRLGDSFQIVEWG